MNDTLVPVLTLALIAWSAMVITLTKNSERKKHSTFNIQRPTPNTE